MHLLLLQMLVNIVSIYLTGIGIQDVVNVGEEKGELQCGLEDACKILVGRCRRGEHGEVLFAKGRQRPRTARPERSTETYGDLSI